MSSFHLGESKGLQVLHSPVSPIASHKSEPGLPSVCTHPLGLQEPASSEAGGLGAEALDCCGLCEVICSYQLKFLVRKPTRSLRQVLPWG